MHPIREVSLSGIEGPLQILWSSEQSAQEH